MYHNQLLRFNLFQRNNVDLPDYAVLLWPTVSDLARRAFRHPMDGHFRGKYIQNSPNLLKNLQETCSLDGQLSISG